jgi:hypothetical protein
MVIPNPANPAAAAQASAVEAHLQAQHQQAVTEAQRRTSYLQMQQAQMQQAPPPMIGGFFPSMHALAVAQMNATAMVATAKLANSKDNKETNSNFVVRSSVPKFNVAGGLYTVAQWARKCVEDNLEWIVKLSRRRDPALKAVMLAYGDGCQTLVLLDDAMNRMPADLNAVQKIGIAVSAAPIDDKSDEKKLAAAGVLQPTDSIWDHLRYEQTDPSKDKVENIMFVHTCMTNYGDGIDGRRRVLQVMTGAPQKPYAAVAYVPNITFEQQVLAKWNGPGAVIPNVAAMNMAAAGRYLPPPRAGGNLMGQPVSAAAATVAASAPPEEDETVITFNPKELILLEKAFRNLLTSRDLKSKADKWSEADKKACQFVIKRANSEFKWITKKKRKKNVGKPAAKKAAPAAKKDAAAAEAAKSAANSTPTNEEKKHDANSAPKPSLAKTAPEPAEGKASARKSAPKKAESAKKDKAEKVETVDKTLTKKSPASVKKADTKKEPKSSVKKSTKEEKEPLKKKKGETVDSDDEPISKLKDTPSAKKSKSIPVPIKPSAKKEEKPREKERTSSRKRSHSEGPKDKKEEKSAKKVLSKSKAKK